MTRHKHAEVMIAYANDTSLVIQMNDGDGEWKDLPVGYKPSFYDNSEYRIKPKIVEKGDFICEIDGVKWWLAEDVYSEVSMGWDEARELVESKGAMLPSREVLLMCYLNKNIRGQFKEEGYWSSSEYEDNPTNRAWVQGFSSGNHFNISKGTTFYVRGVISS